MSSENLSSAIDVMNTRSGHDLPISVATVEKDKLFVRTVDTLYEDGLFYVFFR